MEPLILEARDAYKIYQLGTQEVRAVDGVSFQLRKKDFVSIMGPSGSGKTTFLDLLTAMSRPSRGEVLINGKRVSEMDDGELAQTRGRTIGFVFQVFNLIPRMTALENVMLPLWFAGYTREEREARATDVLGDVGLHDRTHHKPAELSGGQRQRVAIARALAVDPDVIVADEPTGNLDSVSGQQILGLFNELHEKKGKTLLMVTHERYVAEMADKIIYIKDGKISREEGLLKQHANKR